MLEPINNIIKNHLLNADKSIGKKASALNPNLTQFGINSEDDYVLSDFGGLNLYETNDGKYIIEDYDGSLIISYNLEDGDSVQERYDTNNNLIQKEIDSSPDKGAPATKYIEAYSYSSNNQISMIATSKFANSILSKETETFYFYKYDDAGNITGKKQTMYDFENGQYITSQYDGDGKLLSIETKDIDEVGSASYNSIIDKPTTQNGIGDCWLLAGTASLSYNEAGQKVLKDAISKNEDGSYSVYFKGIDKTYTISSEEIAENQEERFKYALGDNDMRIIELAVEKFRDELRENDEESPISFISNAVQDFFANVLVMNQYIYKTNYDLKYSSLHGGSSAQLFKLLTGEDAHFEILHGLDGANKIFNEKENCVAAMDFPQNCTLKDADDYAVDFITNHSYSVKEINDDFIILTNPEDTKNDLKFPLSEFRDVRTRFVYTYLS